jgi:branched-chain amino acid transport system substrate-binding protein
MGRNELAMPERHRRRIALSATLALLCLLPAVSARNGPTAKPTAELSPIVLGVSSAQSGVVGDAGKQLVDGSKAYFDLVNRAGGVNGRTIAVVVKDDHYDPDLAVQNAYELITKDHVFALFDSMGTPPLTRVLPLLEYFQAEHIVTFAPFSGSDTSRHPPYDRYAFNVRASFGEETEELVEYFYGRGYRRFGVFMQADALGMSGESGVRQALAARHLQPIVSASYRRNSSYQTDMSEQVKILRAKNVDAVIAVSIYEPGARFIRDARDMSWNVPIGIMDSESAAEVLGRGAGQENVNSIQGVVNCQVVPSPDDTRYSLVREYRAHVPESEYGPKSLEGWINAVVLTEGLRRAGRNPSRVDFISAMEHLRGWDPGLGVNLDFSVANHQGLHKVWLTKLENGHWVAIPGTPQ